MLTFAAVAPVTDFLPFADARGRPGYGVTAEGLVARFHTDAKGREWAIIKTYGSALRALADQEAPKWGARVVEVQSDYWPGAADILRALEAA